MSVLNDAYELGYAQAPTLAKTNQRETAAYKAAVLYPNDAALRSAYRDGWYAAMCDLSESGNGDDN